MIFIDVAVLEMGEDQGGAGDIADLAGASGGGFYTVGLMVLTLSGTQVSGMTRFDSSTLPRFGLPATLSN